MHADSQKNFKNVSCLKPAAFFDRDGVLNLDHGFVHKPKDFEWVHGAQETVAILNKAGFLVFVVTNQSGIARGLFSEKDVNLLHNWMNQRLFYFGARIDDFFYCPHHPETPEGPYSVECECRKPKPGLILQALEKWPVEKKNSFLIGDSKRDLEAARRAGIKGYLFDGECIKDAVSKIIFNRITK